MYDLYNVNADLESSGIWYNPTEGFQVLLARAGGSNRKYSALVERLIKPHRRAIRNEKADNEVIAQLLKEAFAKTVILNWQVRDKNGDFVDGIADVKNPSKILPVTWQNIYSVIDTYDELYLDIKDMAESSAAYLQEELEEDSKN